MYINNENKNIKLNIISEGQWIDSVEISSKIYKQKFKQKFISVADYILN